MRATISFFIFFCCFHLSFPQTKMKMKEYTYNEHGVETLCLTTTCYRDINNKLTKKIENKNLKCGVEIATIKDNFSRHKYKYTYVKHGDTTLVFEKDRKGASGIKRVKVDFRNNLHEIIYYHSNNSVYYKELITEDNEGRVLVYKKIEPNDYGANISIDSTFYIDDKYTKCLYFFSDSKYYNIHGLYRKVYSTVVINEKQKTAFNRMYNFPSKEDSVLFHTEELRYKGNSDLILVRIEYFENSSTIDSTKYYYDRNHQLTKEYQYYNGILVRRTTYQKY